MLICTTSILPDKSPFGLNSLAAVSLIEYVDLGSLCSHKTTLIVIRLFRVTHKLFPKERCYIFDRFLAIASSTALSCLRSSSLLDTDFLAGAVFTGEVAARFLPEISEIKMFLFDYLMLPDKTNNITYECGTVIC